MGQSSASQDSYTSKPEKIEGVHETVEPTRPVSRESVEIGRKRVPLPKFSLGNGDENFGKGHPLSFEPSTMKTYDRLVRCSTFI